MWPNLPKWPALWPTADRNERNDFPKGCKVLKDSTYPVLDVVLIHEIKQSRDDAWLRTSSSWIRTFENDFPRARIVAFGYDSGVCRDLHDLIDPEKLQNNAEALLCDYPLFVPSREFTPSSRDEEGSKQSTADNGNAFPVNAEHPVIFIAHGFGGLIYETALTISHNPDKVAGRWRKHAAILLDTPHHHAGVADWAIMCANLFRIPCAKTAGQQDWSNLQLKASLEEIDKMQREFRRIIRTVTAVDIVGCYAIQPIAAYNLKLAPEWVVLPDFRSMALNETHFGMTEGKDAEPGPQKSVLSKLIEGVVDGGKREKHPKPRNHLDNLRRISQCTVEDLEEIVDLCSSVIGAVKSLIEFYSLSMAIRHDIAITLEDLHFLSGILKTFYDQLKLRPQKPRSFGNNIALLAPRCKSIADFQEATSKVIIQDVNNITDDDAVLPHSLQQSALKELRGDIHSIASHVSRILHEDVNIRRTPLKLLRNLRYVGNSTTPLRWAAQHGHVFLAKLVVAAEEDTDAVDAHGLSPLGRGAATQRLPLLDQADMWIRQRYSPENLKIVRLSGTTLPMEQCYINLALVQQQQPNNELQKDAIQPPAFHPTLLDRMNIKETTRGDQFDLKTLFLPRKIEQDKDERPPKRILIRGRPGVGKTTLCKKIVHDFVHCQQWKEHFKRLLWVPLRNLSQRQGPYTLKGLIRDEYFAQESSADQMIEELFLQCNRDDDTQSLFLLDGLDEIWHGLDTGSDLHNFVLHLLNRPYVIVTSRPSVHLSGRVRPFGVELETVGFYPTQVEQYVRSMEPQNANIILDFLNKQPLVADLVRIPIQLDALCFAWKDKSVIQSSNLSEPQTMTDLYRAIERGLWKKDAVSLKRAKETENLSPSELEPKVEEEIILLEKLAFTGMHNHLATFDAATIEKFAKHMPSQGLVIDSTLRRLSLVRSSHVSPIDNSREYYFLHLTLQEYFAARYIKRQWIKGAKGELQVLDLKNERCVVFQPQNFLKQHKYEEHFDIVWRFLSGLLNSDKDSQESLFKAIQSQPLDMLGAAHQRLLMRCLFETRANFELRRQLEGQLSTWLDVENRVARKDSHGRPKQGSLAHSMEFPINVICQRLLCQKPSDDQEVVSYLLQSIRLRRAHLVQILDSAVEHLRKHSSKHAVLAAFSFIRQFADVRGTEKSILPEAVVHEVAKKLDHLDATIRSSALYILQDQPSLPSFAMEAILQRHEDNDSTVRWVVIQILKKNKNSLRQDVFIPVVLKKLHTEHTLIREEAVKILQGQLNSPGAVLEEVAGAVAELFDHKDPYTRRAAISVFEDQPNVPRSILQAVADRLDDKTPGVRQAAVHILENQPNIPETVLHAVMQKVNDEDSYVRRAVVQFLQNQGVLSSKLIEINVERLGNQDSEVRQAAMVILGTQSSLPESALQLIVEKVEDHNPNVRQAAIEVLQKQRIFPAAVSKAIAQNLENNDSNIRLVSISALMNQSNLPESVLSTVMTMLKDEDSRIRSAVIRILKNQEHQTEAIFEATFQMLEDQESGVRKDAITALQHLNSSETVLQAFTKRLKDENASVYEAAFQVLRAQPNLSEALLLEVVQILLDKRPEVQQEAGGLLSKQTSVPESVLQATIQIIEDRDEDFKIRCNAIKVFETSLPEAVLAAAVQMLEDGSSDDRDDLYDALRIVSGALGAYPNLPTSVLQAFVQMLQDDEWSYSQENAIKYLQTQASLPEAVLSQVIKKLEDFAENTRWAAFLVLEKQQIRSDHMLEIIACMLMHDDVDHQHAAVDFLNSQPALPLTVLENIVEILDYESYSSSLPWTQWNASSVLQNQEILPESIVQKLVQMFDNPESKVTMTAAEVLGEQSHLPKWVFEAIAGVLDSEDSNHSMSAFHFLSSQPELPKAILEIVARNLRRICLSDMDKDLLLMLRNNPSLALISQYVGSFQDLFEQLLRLSFDDHFVWYSSDQKHCFIIDGLVIEDDLVVEDKNLALLRAIDEAREACSVPVVAIDF